LTTFLGYAVDGGMAERVRVPAGCLVPLPACVPLGDACLVEPLAVGVHGLRLAEVRGGCRVAVVGAGGIGLLAVAAALAGGAGVAVEARHDAQRAAAERLGAATSAQGEYDVVVEAAGTESALSRSVELCRPGGTVLFLSMHWAPVAIPGFATLTKELRYQWSVTYGTYGDGRDLDTAAMLLARNPDIARTVITHRFPLAEAREAFRVAADRKRGTIKVVLDVP
jgi:threonine dehydrogenase-like Zn-dependent dehydrogenase